MQQTEKVALNMTANYWQLINVENIIILPSSIVQFMCPLDESSYCLII